MGQIDEEPVLQVEIDALSAVDSPRISGESQEHVESLAAAQTELPPIIVHRATMQVIDGAHRLKAARLRGEDKIAVRFFDGNEAEAFVMAVRANIAHGLPLSLADRKRAAERIMASHPQWSDRKIASVTGIAARTVAEIRRRMRGTPAASDIRIGQDGRVRPVNGTEGRRMASELIKNDPGMSLRQIAYAAGISPETARDVRNRMRRGMDPLTPQRSAGTGPRTRPAAHSRSEPDRAAVVARLRADPALRFSETGRKLLMLLNLHTIDADEWDRIIANVPPHCSRIVADLARGYAELWRDFADRVR